MFHWSILQGIIELKRSRPEFASSADDLIDSSPYLTDFLDRFYMARVGIRMLIGQHIALHQARLVRCRVALVSYIRTSHNTLFGSILSYTYYLVSRKNVKSPSQRLCFVVYLLTHMATDLSPRTDTWASLTRRVRHNA